MARHLSHQMAREGFLVRPEAIQTLSRFAEPWAKDAAPVPAPVLSLLVEKALERLSPEQFKRVANYPGFRGALARLIQEVAAAGGDSRQVGASPAFAAIFAEVEAELVRRKCALDPVRLRIAAGRIAHEGLSGVRQVCLDGFFSLSPPELALVDAIHRHSDVTVTLPSWEGAEEARQSLLRFGFAEETLQPVRTRPQVSFTAAPTLDQEVEDIARRILEQNAEGRPFREMGVLVRSRDPYVPALQTTLERFGIPARYYFGVPLAGHSVTRYLSEIVESMLGGWEHERTLEAMRMAESGTAGDRFEFRARELLPGQGLESLREIAAGFGLGGAIDALARLDAWRNGVASPKHWAARAKSLRALVPRPAVTDGVSHEKAAIWRAEAAALNAFDDAMDQTAGALDDAAIPFAEFWREAVRVIGETTLRVPDRRRDVVHVIDAYEARQWELPVMFVCGLLEKQFPRHRTEDPILPNAMRERLALSRLRLRTTGDWEQEERFLFDLAVTRATGRLILSYPRYNAGGDETLRSFCLDRFLQEAHAEEGQAIPVRPQAAHPRAARRVAAIYDGDLRQWIAEKFRTMRPTAIERFLQCPFRFFVEQTLRLTPPPSRPEERLDPLAQGTIVHEVLKQWQRREQPLEPLFARVFEETCRSRRIPPGYRTETMRREMFRNLKRALTEIDLGTGWRILTEEDVHFELEAGLEISGRIDRYDVSPEGKVLVVDYKYSSDSSLKQRVREDGENNRFVQGGLYLLALEDRGYEPAGMLYCGLKKETTWHGRCLVIAGLKQGVQCTPEVLREDLDKARDLSLWAAGRIREGTIEASGADARACQYCDSYDLCRVESRREILRAGAPLP
jgi:ATP-dependent helicase/DNAse subunit B